MALDGVPRGSPHKLAAAVLTETLCSSTTCVILSVIFSQVAWPITPSAVASLPPRFLLEHLDITIFAKL